MRSTILSVAMAGALVAGAAAQNLDSEIVFDTFDSGTRGNALGTGPTFCNSLLDGSEFQTLTDTDGVIGTIVYINTWAGCTTLPQEDETPVVDFTAAHDNQDRALTGALEAIPANTNDSVSPNNGIIVGDDGGFNALMLGDPDSRNYFIQADVYCFDRTAAGLSQYEVYGVIARGFVNSAEADIETGGLSYDRQGSYGLEWDAQRGVASARRWEANWSGGTGLGSGDIGSRVAGTFTEFGTQALSEGWHTFRIECVNNEITFLVDGSEIASETDSTYAVGRAGLSYRETGVASADETQGHFDNLVAGPTVANQANQFSFLGSFTTNNAPLPIASDASGGLYYGTIDGASSSVYHVADPIAETGDTDPSDHALVGAATFPTGRGFQGLGVGTDGSVYASGDASPDGVLLKFGPAPTFTADATFNGNAAAAVTGARHGGLALLGDDSLATARFNSLAYFDQTTGNLIRAIGGPPVPNYQREVLYNPADETLYALKNGNDESVMLAGVWQGSTPAEASYEFSANELISDGAVNSTFGIATAHGFVDQDPLFPRLFTINTVGAGDSDIRIWQIEPGGDALTLLNTVDPVAAAGASAANDCVLIGDRLYVTSFTDSTIYVFEATATTAAHSYELYR